MSWFWNVVIGLVSLVAGSAATWAWEYAKIRYRYGGTRAFWRPFLGSETLFVTGQLETSLLVQALHESLSGLIVDEETRREVGRRTLEHLQEQEISGLLGRGDIDALVSIHAELARAHLPTTMRVVAPGDVGDRRGLNLVLLGGPDVNPLTKEVLDQLSYGFEFARDGDRNIIRRSDFRRAVYPAVRETVTTAGGANMTEVHDYGLIVRAENPLGESPSGVRGQLLILAGAHGFGTLAAARVLFSKSSWPTLRSIIKAKNGAASVLVSYTHKLTEGNGAPSTQIEIERSAPVRVRDSA